MDRTHANTSEAACTYKKLLEIEFLLYTLVYSDIEFNRGG